MRRWRQISERAAANHGRVPVPELHSLGVSDAALSRAVRSGVLSRPQPKVLAVAGAPTTDMTRLVDILASIGPHAAITSWGALWLEGLVPHLPTTVDTIFPVTLLFLARTAHVEYLRALMIHARQRGLLDMDELDRLLVRAGNAPGTRVLRRLWNELKESNADSMLEIVFRQQWADTPWPQPSPNTLKIETPRHPVTLDVPWPEYLTAVDCHGRGKYDETWTLDADTRRDNHVKATDWRVLEASWGRVTGPQWPQLVEEIVDVLDLQAKRLGLAPVRPR